MKKTLSCVLLAPLLVACQKTETPQPTSQAAAAPIKIAASIQEMMAGIVDPAADGVWDVVGTTLTPKKVEEHQPRTDEEWREARLHALTLIEATNLLVMEGRRLVPPGGKILDEGSDGVLPTAEAQQRMDSQHQTFVQFALALREVGEKMLKEIDARNPAGMVEAGTEMDDVCESCHMTFWYPNQAVYRITVGDGKSQQAAPSKPGKS
jgi:hypothetical protein